jgi:hypothetical protein
MLLIVYYVAFMLGGSLSAYLIGLIVERAFGSYASLIVFLALYFLSLWISWLLDCGLDDPTKTHAGCTALAWLGACRWQLLARADEVIE